MGRKVRHEADASCRRSVPTGCQPVVSLTSLTRTGYLFSSSGPFRSASRRLAARGYVRKHGCFEAVAPAIFRRCTGAQAPAVSGPIEPVLTPSGTFPADIASQATLGGPSASAG